MLRMQLFRSCGPVRKTFNSRLSSSLQNWAKSRSSSASWRGCSAGGFLLGQFQHDLEIVNLPFGLEHRLGFFAQGIGLVDEALGLFAIVPEILLGHQSIQFRQPFLRARHVKETSANGRLFPRRPATAL